jgi:hypothetical protein
VIRPSQEGAAGLSEIKRLPIRIHLPNLPAPIQHPVQPYTAEGNLGELFGGQDSRFRLQHTVEPYTAKGNLVELLRIGG